jgi:hypothetical protein
MMVWGKHEDWIRQSEAKSLSSRVREVVGNGVSWWWSVAWDEVVSLRAGIVRKGIFDSQSDCSEEKAG